MEINQEKKLELSNDSAYHINTTWKWTLFLSIMGFIFVGFIFILAIAIGPILRTVGAEHNMVFPGMLAGVAYFFIGIVTLVPVIFLYLFSVKAKKAIQLQDTYYLDQAFKNLKYHYVIYGILTIIGIGIYFLIGLGAGLTAIFN